MSLDKKVARLIQDERERCIAIMRKYIAATSLEFGQRCAYMIEPYRSQMKDLNRKLVDGAATAMTAMQMGLDPREGKFQPHVKNGSCSSLSDSSPSPASPPSGPSDTTENSPPESPTSPDEPTGASPSP